MKAKRHLLCGSLAVAVGLVALSCGEEERSRDEAVRAFPTSAPRVSVVNGFLLIDGRELSVPVLPCSADAATPGDPALFPLRIGRLPDGAREEKTEVSICPDGSLVSAVRVYVLDGDGRGRRLTVGLWTATESFPPVLAWPEGFMIDPVEINGHRGLLVIPEEGTDSVASLRFWVKEHGYPNDPGAYVYISEETPGTAAAAELVDIGKSITVSGLEAAPLAVLPRVGVMPHRAGLFDQVPAP